MNELTYRFFKHNNSNGKYIVYPGAPFLLDGFKYRTTIYPETQYWRFGFRFSMDENFLFVENNSADSQAEIFLEVGNSTEHPSDKESVIFLIYRNYSGEDSMLQVNRIENSDKAIYFEIEYDDEANAIYIRYFSDGSEEYTNVVEFDLPFRFMKIFSWSESEVFELDSRIEVISFFDVAEPEGRSFPFKVGNVLFKLGSMFDTFSSYNNALIVFPVATDGLFRGVFHDKIRDLAIPFPTENKPGTLIIHKSNSNIRYPFVAYAYSVDGKRSSPQIISNICKELKSRYSENADNVGLHKRINMPLLGTGAGKMTSVNVASIYDEEFNYPGEVAKVLVSVQSTKDFEEIQRHFLGRYVVEHQERIYKPKEILDLENKYSIEIDFSLFSHNIDGHITHLTLSHLNAENLEMLKDFPFIESLTLSSSTISSYGYLNKLHFLRELNLIKCNITDLEFLAFLKLTTLTLNSLNIRHYDLLQNLAELENLTITNCEFSNIGFLRQSSNLRALNLSRCEISSLVGLEYFDHLQNLNLSENRINDLHQLADLENLSVLILNDNKISDISVVLKLKKLTYLRAEGNPFVSRIKLILNSNENHLLAIKNYYSRQKETGKVEVRLPAKVILLGNHASGKSSLLSYIINDSVGKSPDSTHIIKIEKFWNGSQDMPEAIFFDFGGQDYYHGIYRAFLSSGALYLLLWNSSNNNNQIRVDSRNTNTQDFTLAYWLGQKKYLESEKFDGNVDPLFVIQSRADKDSRKSVSTYSENHNIDNEFFVSLKADPSFLEDDFAIANHHALQYLKSSIKRKINSARTLTEEPKWYSNFLMYILQEGRIDTWKSKNVSNDILPQYKRSGPNKLESLVEELDQLHKRGLILYYKYEIPDKVWLNPERLVTYIHDEVLNMSEIGRYNGIIPERVIKKFDQEIIDLLCSQKIIFKHDLTHTVEYIAPNFLPLVSKHDQDFELFTFDLGQPFFVLKFLNFLPFGIINQLICLFKNEPDDTKKFWRNQLLFTFKKKSKVLINVDFERLEIKVHSFFKKDVSEVDKTNIHKYLFYAILSVYWGLDMLEYDDYLLAIKGSLKKEDYEPDTYMYSKIVSYESIYEKQDCRPLDLFISTDLIHFVNYDELCSSEIDSQTINSRVIDSSGELTNKNVSLPIYGFQTFTQRTLKRIRKVVISYSKRDLKLVNKFKDYLVPLYQNGLIESPWYCTELIAGQEWNEEIKQRFLEADIIFFMISENLMSTKYVLENEIKDAIDRWDNGKSIKIVPILLEPYNFVRKDPYNLGRFSALPFTLQPITEFNNQKLAWHAVSECIRIAIQKDIDPTSSGELTTELKTIFEKIVKEKFD